MPENHDRELARAEARFKSKQARDADAPKAVQEYRAAQKAALARMHQLRELRLAREAKKKRRAP